MRIPFLGGLGVPELIIILIVVLLIFGPKNLPKLGSAIGRTVKNLREGMDGDKKEAEKPAQQTAEAAEGEEAVYDYEEEVKAAQQEVAGEAEKRAE